MRIHIVIYIITVSVLFLLYIFLNEKNKKKIVYDNKQPT